MDNSRKESAAGPSGSYRRIIPPLNDTDSDSSLEYWEERPISERYQMKLKTEPIDEDETETLQRMVYTKVTKNSSQSEPERPPRNNAGPSTGSQGPPGTPPATQSTASSSSPATNTTLNNPPTDSPEEISMARRNAWNLQKLTLSPSDVLRRDMLRMTSNGRYTKRRATNNIVEDRCSLERTVASRCSSLERTITTRDSAGQSNSSEHSYATSVRAISPASACPSSPKDSNSQGARPSIPTSSNTPVLDTTASPPPAKRLRTGDEASGLNSNILSMIECPVCLEYMAPPIHQCRRGHLVCSSCRAQLVNCPTCRSRFTDLRNLVLERIVEMIKYPCKHDNCNEMLLLKHKGAHELNCMHRRYTCMAQGCDWRGVHSELVPHVRSVHSGLIHDGNKLVISFPIQMLANSSRNYVLHAFNEMFRVNFQRGPGNSLVHGAVIYLGPIDNAKNFTFEFKMQKEKEGTERVLAFKRTALSDDQKPSNYYSKSEAFCASVDMLRLIATSKGKVHVDVNIERKVQKKDVEAGPSNASNESNDEPEEPEDK